MRPIDADTLKEALDDGWQPDIMVGELWEIVDKQPTVSGWVSINEKLPDKEGSYLVMTERAFEHVPYKVMEMDFEIATINGREKRRWKWNGKLPIWPVTHWMPLPEPPREENSNG